MKHIASVLLVCAAAANAQIVSMSIGVPVFTGPGLNDAVIGGTYAGVRANHLYGVSICTAGTPDTLKTNRDGGTYTGCIAATGSAQALAYPAGTLSGCTWASGRASCTTTSPHGMSDGALVTITGASPSGYNVTGVLVLVTGSATFAVPLAANPGTFTSSGGQVTAADGLTVTLATTGHAATSAWKVAATGNANPPSFVATGLGAVVRSQQDKLRDAHGVKDMGAKGDGVSDDWASFAAALATWMDVQVPAGTYALSQSISLVAGQHLQCAARGDTVLQFTGATNGLTLMGTGSPENFDFGLCTISTTNAAGLAAIYANGGSTTFGGVTISSHLVTTSGAGYWHYGFWADDIESSHIEGLHVHGNIDVHIHLQHFSNANTFVAPFLGAPGQIAFEADGCEDNAIIGGTMQGSMDNPVWGGFPVVSSPQASGVTSLPLAGLGTGTIAAGTPIWLAGYQYAIASNATISAGTATITLTTGLAIAALAGDQITPPIAGYIHLTNGSGLHIEGGHLEGHGSVPLINSDASVVTLDGVELAGSNSDAIWSHDGGYVSAVSLKMITSVGSEGCVIRADGNSGGNGAKSSVAHSNVWNSATGGKGICFGGMQSPSIIDVGIVASSDTITLLDVEAATVLSNHLNSGTGYGVNDLDGSALYYGANDMIVTDDAHMCGGCVILPMSSNYNRYTTGAVANPPSPGSFTKVGIGVTAPLALLHIAGGTALGIQLDDLSRPGTHADRNWLIANGCGNINYGSIGFFVSATEGGTFTCASNPAAQINSAGKFGIGVTGRDPTDLLEVFGSLNLSNAGVLKLGGVTVLDGSLNVSLNNGVFGGTMQVTGTSLLTGVVTAPNGLSAGAVGAAAAPSLVSSNFVNRLTSNSDATIDNGFDPSSPFGAWLQVKDSSRTASYPMLLQPSGGRVGVGTRNPGYQLDVQGGDVNTSGTLRTAGVTRIDASGNGVLGSSTTIGGGTPITAIAAGAGIAASGSGTVSVTNTAPFPAGGANLTVSCPSTQAIKTATVVNGLITAATCGVP